jgi:hypothetical protein
MTDSTTIRLKDDPNPSQVGEFVDFTAFVAANSTHPTSVPSGTVQFIVDGVVVGAPVLVDAKGPRLLWHFATEGRQTPRQCCLFTRCGHVLPAQ